MELSNFNVIALSETWLSPDIQDDKIIFQNYQKPFRKDRPDNANGCVIIYVKIISPVNEERTWKWTELNLFG